LRDLGGVSVAAAGRDGAQRGAWLARSRHLLKDEAEIGERLGDPDLLAFGRLGTGESLILLGKAAAGMSLVDEVMLAVTRLVADAAYSNRERSQAW
jgi:hypothetical protein